MNVDETSVDDKGSTHNTRDGSGLASTDWSPEYQLQYSVVRHCTIQLQYSPLMSLVRHGKSSKLFDVYRILKFIFGCVYGVDLTEHRIIPLQGQTTKIVSAL